MTIQEVAENHFLEKEECIHDVYKAMEEYARIRSIEFCKFAMKKSCQDMNTDERLTLDDDTMSEISYEDFYDNLFNQSKLNKQ